MDNRTAQQVQQRLARRAHLLPDFLAVVRGGGIRQAAEQLALSQSALTRRIQELEAALGVELFERSVRGMSLTLFGTALRHHAEILEQGYGYAASELADLADAGVGELRVAAGPAWTYRIAPAATARLLEKLPRARLSMLVGVSERRQALLDSRIDVVLAGLPTEAQREPAFAYARLMEMEHEIYANLEHPLHRLEAVTPAQLAQQGWIWLRDSMRARSLVADLFRTEELQAPASIVETTSLQFAMGLLQRTPHLMVLPSALRSDAARDHIIPLRLARPLGRYTTGLIFRPALSRLRIFREFHAALQEVVRELP